MPQAELYYSQDLALDAPALLRDIEAIIHTHDPSSGACKGRAFAVADTHHRHVLLQIALLEKAHRTPAFLQALQDKLAHRIAQGLPSPTALGVELRFLSPHYLTIEV
ncbi:hypothetical protein TRM7557_00732 [Tritonibacter multivorans]|uniref:5-carboxymethyl-2-hydroxymuconate isomerase n=1 Tax=Tritonibacter multivorans TaxID=928856 RepID=A0A0P1G3A4_9RHOB|nr:hypothetical protein [Tritonibacter multivorans]MDA7419769.1 hypothetical protein [Tritonibacter multivorans]CUH76139.1 hypothetical protein TRM7557_00732 [Tritonibacter multivorans]SFC54642.1 hypothetical protein SAMN04488049_10350 [Tritonibacter multivorans]